MVELILRQIESPRMNPNIKRRKPSKAILPGKHGKEMRKKKEI